MGQEAHGGAGAAQRLERLAAEAELERSWYAWCDADLDWALAAEATYEPDDLGTQHGGFAPLETREFLGAFESAGAAAWTGSSWPGQRHRSFTARVAAGDVEASLEVRLGRGSNAMECRLGISEGGQPAAPSVLLHVLAREILNARAEDSPDPSHPYPRLMIGSRSQLEVVSRELVDLMLHIARGWRG